jgi:hypothetical protein
VTVVDNSLIGRKFWGNLGPLVGFNNVITFTSLEGLENWTAEDSDWIHLSDIPVVFLEDEQSIRLERFQVHKRFSISINLQIYVYDRVLVSQRGAVYRCEQSF